MTTFCAIDDTALIQLINAATRRIVFISPGVHKPVADALINKLTEVDTISITVVLDPSDDVCRMGFGDIEALTQLSGKARSEGFWLRSQSGLRMGVLISDDQTLVWAPTPRAIELPPNSCPQPEDLFAEPLPLPANGMLLGTNPSKQIINAVSAEGEDIDPRHAEIGQSAITPKAVDQTKEALLRNPPIPVDLERITRVFSTKLQFVELKVRHAAISRAQLSIPTDLLNADAKADLKGLLDSKLRAFSDLRHESIPVPAFNNSERSYNKDNQPQEVSMTESDLESVRRHIERRFTYDIQNFGRLIAKDDRQEFEKNIEAYRIQLDAHAKGLKERIKAITSSVINDAVSLIQSRLIAGKAQLIDKEKLHSIISNGLQRNIDKQPVIDLLFKDITFEQTQSIEFLEKVQIALPPNKRQQLGNWSEHFLAAKAIAPSNKSTERKA